jgi:amino acid transporter
VTEDPPSTLPFILRRSFQLSSFQVVLLGVGAWLLIGVFGGFDAIAAIAGIQSWLAYALFTLLLLPTVLSHVELRQGIRRTGGSYRLLQSLAKLPGSSRY